ncbi:BICD family-like cargo adapter 1 [Astyanax mexicanus]|uniref:BICD family-like cargo adapter 1 n=1 Tax=Astyanax mexicanus TaxID=7994 RepID=UPI0020CABA0A|nr:BICD family-like cargo adapter 1 [Astyanax mexicanus]
MNRVEELCFEAHRKELEEEEDFYPYEFDPEEELPAYGDGEDLLAALRQKEEEVLLAAQLGKALLLENRQLKEERGKLHEQYADKVEELEQGRHELRLKLQDCQAQWESQVAELERDVRELRGQVEGLTRALSETEKEKSRDKQQHAEISQQLREQLQAAMDVERTVTAELHNLKQELRERGHPRPQDEELLSALKEQVARLTQREQALTQRLETVCEENTELRDRVSSLHTRLALQEQQSRTQTQQLTEAWQEVETARCRSQELQAQMEELQEEVSLQHSDHGDTSLLSEMEHSLDAMGWSQEKEQVTQDVSTILDMLLPGSLSSGSLCNQEDSLKGMLGQLKSVVESIAQGQTLQELKKPIVGEESAQCEKTSWILELRDQNERLLEEIAELRLKADSRLDEEIVQRAIKDRDDAIAKKTAVEAELVRSKNDIMCLNNQLLEAIQRKLELSQELEAWQDDIQIIINQQLKSQHQTEQQSEKKRPGVGRISFLRKSRKPSVSPPCVPEITSAPNHSPWKDWLKLGK